ncbi:alpha-galactosidase [Proteiniphilum sp. X52]|nr:alpha-galactosidase [Proteiniphilum sp. X52]
MRGKNSLFPVVSSSGSDLVENPALLNGSAPYYHFLPFSSPHYATRIVSFREATDHHSNIVRSSTELPYRKPQYYEGNVLIARNNRKNEFHLVVKQSPLQDAQSAYTGFDFSTDFSGIKVHSPGFDFGYDPGRDTCWQEAYCLFTVMYAGSEKTALNLYKKYELTVHRYLPHMDNTFTMNTWGDRNRDSRINEAFILNELEAASRLGITHYQIDDGWQQGLSRNSAQKANMLWDDWGASDWEVNSTRFPNGLAKVKEKAASMGISLGLWFNPSKKGNYAAWQRDKDILTGLHGTHGLSWIKIDGLEIGDKLSESRVRQMLQGAAEESDFRLQFNMDVTAGKRGGYFYFNRLGNIFLENRYTDWGNYYPHLTLRNIWSLAEYVPIQRIQVEWLNKWRNEQQYPENDPLSPGNIPFDYQFAITMMGQPLAWMEATGLPDEAFDVRSLIDIWKSERSRMQQGVISPVGQIPDGFSFPGFVSCADDRVYVLLFRENTSHSTGRYDLSRDIDEMNFVKLAGDGAIVDVEGSTVEVNYTKPFQFLWGYLY